MSKLNMRLLADRVLVVVTKEKEVKTASGIYLPPTDSEEKTLIGKVLRTSKQIDRQAEEWEKVEAGDEVLFSAFAGSDVKYKGVSYRILRITDLFSVLDKEE